MCVRCSQKHVVYTGPFMPGVCVWCSQDEFHAWCVYDVHKMHAWCVYDVHKNIMSWIWDRSCLMCLWCSQDACMPDVCTMFTRCMPDVCTMFTKTCSVYGTVHAWCVCDVHKMNSMPDVCVRCSQKHHVVYTVPSMPGMCDVHKMNACLVCVCDVHKMNAAWCVYDVHKNIMSCIRDRSCLMCVRHVGNNISEK
jgi:hypothetical protein